MKNVFNFCVTILLQNNLINFDYNQKSHLNHCFGKTINVLKCH